MGRKTRRKVTERNDGMGGMCEAHRHGAEERRKSFYKEFLQPSLSGMKITLPSPAGFPQCRTQKIKKKEGGLQMWPRTPSVAI